MNTDSTMNDLNAIHKNEKESVLSASNSKPLLLNEVSSTNESTITTPDDLAEHYTFIKKLGQGTQATVYEAIRKSDGLHVAIKTLAINSIQNWKEYDLFWREVDTLKTLEIDGVAKFYDAIENLEQPAPHAYLIQQCIRGRSIAEMIADGLRFSVQDVFRIGVQLIDIIDKLHHHNPPIIHRDIKPSNILLEPDGNFYKVYLTDFGAVADPLIQKGGSTVAGTYGYMPPEQLMGKPCAASDIYAFGATLAGLLSGMEPADMEISDYRLMIEKPLENLPYPIVSCLRLMTMPNLEDRFCDYEKLNHIFTDFSNGKYFSEDLPIDETYTAKQLNHALKKVHLLGQNGNTDLWLHLPENTPRKVPQSYQCILNTMTYHKAFSYNLKLNDTLNKLNPKFFTEGLRFNYLINLFIFFPVMFILFSSSFFQQFIHKFFVTLGLIFNIRKLSAIPAILRYPHLNKFNIHAYRIIQDLLQNGRKAMATVIKIDYVSKNVNPKEMKFQALCNDPAPVGGCWADYGYYRSTYNLELPIFRVTYTFNPPDDSSANDLYHTIYLPYDPTLALHTGDMLPILYRIDPLDNSRVTSMPFPFPLDRIHRLEHVICQTWRTQPVSLESDFSES